MFSRLPSGNASVALILALLYANVARALDWTAEPFNPPAIPLAVRTPYLSTWLPQGEGAALNDRWATFWTGSVRKILLLLVEMLLTRVDKSDCRLDGLYTR